MVMAALSLLDNSLTCKNFLPDSIFFDKLIALTARPVKDGPMYDSKINWTYLRTSLTLHRGVIRGRMLVSSNVIHCEVIYKYDVHQ